VDVKGFHQFQNEIWVIDVNLNGVVDPEDVAIAMRLEGVRKGERIDFDHPRYVELREQYQKFLDEGGKV